MSLDIFYVYSDTKREQTWHVGDKLEFLYSRSAIKKIQASGDELEFIRQRFDNLPIAKGNFCKWRGKLARFIADNL